MSNYKDTEFGSWYIRPFMFNTVNYPLFFEVKDEDEYHSLEQCNWAGSLLSVETVERFLVIKKPVILLLRWLQRKEPEPCLSDHFSEQACVPRTPWIQMIILISPESRFHLQIYEIALNRMMRRRKERKVDLKVKTWFRETRGNGYAFIFSWVSSLPSLIKVLMWYLKQGFIN